MIRLYGHPLSNYYNMVKVVLLEKGFDFEEVPTNFGADPKLLTRSPLGRIPFLEVSEGYLSETGAILDFLEDIQPDMPLYPETPFERARVRQLMRIAETTIDAPVRPAVAIMLAGGTPGEDILNPMRQGLERGLAGLGRAARFNPWLAGEDFTYADIVAYYALQLAGYMARTYLHWNILTAVEGLDDWRREVAERHFVAQVDRDRKAAAERQALN